MGAMSFCFYHIDVSDVSQKKLVLKDVLIGKNCMKLFASFPPNAHVKFADLIFKFEKKNLIDVEIIILTPNMLSSWYFLSFKNKYTPPTPNFSFKFTFNNL